LYCIPEKVKLSGANISIFYRYGNIITRGTNKFNRN
jgi:hypothetical protein